MAENTALIEQIISQAQKGIVDKTFQVELALAAFLSGGHLLIEDIPGVGKTTLAKTLSRVLGLHYSRVQFTSDLLPSDIIGINYYDTKEGSFSFKQGPLFTQFLLADEINRATSKTQSALLEAMEEHQVSVEGKRVALPEPFFVIATKNPFEEVGTFELPASQLDRFALSFSLGYPSEEAERTILLSNKRHDLQMLQPIAAEELAALKASADKVHFSEALLDLVQEILHFTRQSGLFKYGLSTRAAIILTRTAKAWALIRGRDYAMPSDVTTLLPYVIAHRLVQVEGRSDPEEMSRVILKNIHPDH